MSNVTARTYNSFDYIALDEVREWLRVASNDDDAIISTILDAAFNHLSNLLGYEVRKSTVDHFFKSTNNGVLHIPARLLSITSVKYRDTNGDLQTLASTDYDEILTLSANYGYDIQVLNVPSLYSYGWKWKVTVVEGFDIAGASVDVSKIFPDVLKLAIRKLCEDMYTQRGDMVVGAMVNKLPVGFDNFISAYQIREFV